MKKVFLYLIFLSLFFSNSQVHAAAFFESAGVKMAIHKIQNKKAIRDGFSKRGPFSHKSDSLNDYDDDCDDFDCEDYSTSFKDKVLFITTTYLTETLSSIATVSKPFCDKIYYQLNSSRLPRFNFISLRVLRL